MNSRKVCTADASEQVVGQLHGVDADNEALVDLFVGVVRQYGRPLELYHLPLAA
jgi:hypothetical protein